MKFLAGLVATLVILTLMPTPAQAQRGGRGGTVNTPYGQFTMNEILAAGGDPAAAGQIREQKMMMLQQQQMIKQEQLYMQQMVKQKKAREDYLKKNPDAARAEAEAQARYATRPVRKSTTKAKSSTASKTAAATAGKTAAATASKTTAATASKIPGVPDGPTGSK